MTQRERFEAWLASSGRYADGIPDWGPIAAGVEALATNADRYQFLRRRTVMVDYSDETATILTLFKDEGPTGEFLDDWVNGEIAKIKEVT
jgi:hypothetical protein